MRFVVENIRARVTEGVENSILQALHFQEVSIHVYSKVRQELTIIEQNRGL
jgi:hypothetical protein